MEKKRPSIGDGFLEKGPTGLVFRPVGLEGLLKTYHICHSDEVGEILDFLADNFEFACTQWADKQEAQSS